MFRTIFVYLSQKNGLKDYIKRIPFTRALVDRFIAGEDLVTALNVVKELNSQKFLCTMDKLGESVDKEEEVERVVEEYKNLLKSIKEKNLNSTISIKLTHLGLLLSEELAYESVKEILEYAKELNNRVCIDMENSPFTQKTLDIYKRVFEEFGNVGVAIQSYLRRTEEDIKWLSDMGAEVRLCKGAYKEPKEIAFQKKKEVDENYRRCLDILLSPESINKGTYPCIATHDERLIDYTYDLVRKNRIPEDKFEFQMLYGIRRDLQHKIVEDGFRMRVYVPYGKDWYPYFMRRLGERPANLFFVFRNILKE